jgi:hypothetical protein
VQKIEEEMLRAGAGEAQVDARLSDPDFSASLQNALHAAARTSEKERHELLAEMVANRLRAEAADRGAVISNLAIEVLPKLSTAQLAFLGLRMSLVLLAEPPTTAGSQVIRAQKESILARMRDRFHEVDQLDAVDFLHLASVSCAVHGGGVVKWELERIIPNSRGWEGIAIREELAKLPSGPWLIRVWAKGGAKVSLTPVGTALGLQVFTRRWNEVPSAHRHDH